MQRDRSYALRFPSLVLPFAVLGGAVGWAATNLLENPLVSIAMYASPIVAAFTGAIAASLVGLAMTAWARRQPGRDDAWIRPVRLRMRLVAGVVLSGFGAGAFVGGITRLHGGLWSGAVCGGITAVFALPLISAVFAAGVRAQRARLGSIVAAADGRAIWAMCGGALVVPALATALDWPMWTAGRGDAPWPGLLMTMGAIGLLIGVVARDRAALADLDVAASGTREATRDPSIDAPKIDLGLGEGLAARYAATASAYRGGEREEMVLVGSVREAASALRRARTRSLSALGAAVACGTVHLVAASHIFDRQVLVAACDHDTSWCRVAGGAFDEHGGDPAVSLGLLAKACRAYDASACDALGSTIVSRTERFENQPCCVSALAATCAGGVGASCRWLSEYAATETGRLPTAGSDLACRGGELATCGATTGFR